MKLWSDSFDEGAVIPVEFAFGKHHPETHVELSDNKNPHLAWSDLPEGTKSLALLCHDPDVPSEGDKVNQEGEVVPWDLKRIDFYHWVLVDLKTDGTIEAGSHSKRVTLRGKDGPRAPDGARHGINNFTSWFEGDDDMKGCYYGYDGPGPPWNDERIHHYHFTLYALSSDRCSVDGDKFTGPDVLKAIEGHVLDKASITGTYAIYPNAR